MTLDELDALIDEAGGTHVIPHREEPALLTRLRDPAVLARASARLASKDKRVRGPAILCIERIGYVLRDQESADALLDFAHRTADRYDRMTALASLARCTPPRPIAAAPLLAIASQPHVYLPGLIECLPLAPHAEVEPALLALTRDRDRFAVAAAARALARLSSTASREALETLLGHASDDVQSAALWALAARLGPEALPHARRVIRTGKPTARVRAEDLICEHGDEGDVAAIAERLRAMRGKKTAWYPTRVEILVPFLRKFPGTPAAVAALAELGEHIASLPASEQRWLRANASEVAR